MTSTTSNAPATRVGGLALMAATVLTFLASVLQPGALLINPVDQTDFALAIRVMADHAGLSHLMTMLLAMAMLLYAYGYSTLLRVAPQPGWGGPVLRFGIAANMFCWAVFIIAMGMRHLGIHLMQRASDAEADLMAGFENLALNTYVAMAGVVLALVAVYPFASMMVGVSLARRFSSMNIFKLASHGLTAVGLGGLVNFLAVQHAPGIDPASLLAAHNILLLFGAVCQFFIGRGMYRGRNELSSAD